jgi:ribosomal protein S6
LKTAIKRLYEGLFLVDSAQAAGEWDNVVGIITGMLKKYGAEVVRLDKWDDRKLAYEVQGKSRGTYILVYFNSPTDVISAIEREVNLSEDIIRVLILRTDKMSEEDLERPTPFQAAEQRQAEFEKKAKVEDEGDYSTDDIDYDSDDDDDDYEDENDDGGSDYDSGDDDSASDDAGDEDASDSEEKEV